MEANGQTIKLVCRYQQFRAVQRAVSRMADRQDKGAGRRV
jgi:type I site-specific restriction-modification system R (restriction) subunit